MVTSDDDAEDVDAEDGPCDCCGRTEQLYQLVGWRDNPGDPPRMLCGGCYDVEMMEQ